MSERFLKLQNLEELVTLKEKKRAEWREDFLKLMHTKLIAHDDEGSFRESYMSFSRAIEKEFGKIYNSD